MSPTRRILLSAIASAGILAAAGSALVKKHEHHSGKDLLGNKITKNGKHVLHKKGPHAVAVDVKDGKIAGVTVQHDTKGNVPVKKYKTNKKMAATDELHFVAYSGMLARAYSVGTTYIGNAYIDEYGDEQIHWWPYEMIYDPWTDAIEYVPYA